MTRAHGLVTRKKTIALLGVAVGAARARVTIEAANFHAAVGRSCMEQAYELWIAARREYQAALEAYFEASWACERGDIEAQLRAMLGVRAGNEEARP